MEACIDKPAFACAQLRRRPTLSITPHPFVFVCKVEHYPRSIAASMQSNNAHEDEASPYSFAPLPGEIGRRRDIIDTQNDSKTYPGEKEPAADTHRCEKYIDSFTLTRKLWPLSWLEIAQVHNYTRRMNVYVVLAVARVGRVEIKLGRFTCCGARALRA